MNFADYFTFENFKEFEETQKKIEDDPDRHRKYAELYDRLFGNAFLNFLKDYSAKYGFPAIENGEGHNTHIQAALDKFFKGEELIGYEQREIPMLFYKVINMGTMNFRDEEETEEYFKNKYNSLIDKFNKGNFDKYELAEDCCKCYDCDQRLKMTINNWKPKFNNIEFLENFKSRLIDPEPCIDKNIIELSVTFEKGELLISDWFKIPEFTETFSNDFEINSIKGRIESTKHHLETGNVLHVVLGNCSPTVLKKGNSLVFGYEDEEIDSPRNGFIRKGRVTTDLWATTIVEKDQLINIVAKQLEKKANDGTSQVDYIVEAKKKVAEYLSRNSGNILKIKVEPGQYNLKFHGNYHQFNKKSEDKEIPLNVEPYFIVEKPKLELDNKPARKKKM